MPSTGKLCFLVVLACILGPIAAGYLLPSGESEDKTGYRESNPVNVTQDLYNNTEPYSATYTGIANNSYWGSIPEYVSVSDTVGTLRAWNTNYTPHTVASAGTIELNKSFFQTIQKNTHISFFDWYISDQTTLTLNGTRISGFEYDGGDLYFIAGDKQYSIDSTIVVSSNRAITYRAYSLLGYADPAQGAYPKSGGWTNYLHNESLDFVIRDAGEGYTLRASDFNGYDYITITRSGAEVTATYMQADVEPPTSSGPAPEPEYTSIATLNIGNFRDVLLRYTIADSGAVTVELSGLSYAAAISDDVQSRIVDLRELATVAPISALVDVDYRQQLTFYPTVAKSAIMYCDSVTYTAGSYSVMLNSSLNAALYFPEQNCSAELRSISQYGDSITLPGAANANLPVTGGYVTVTGTENGETVSKEVKLRELTLLAVYDSENRSYACYVDGILLGQTNTPAIVLNGAWILTAYVYKTEAYTYTTLEWDLGTFNLDATGFCLVGLLCSFVAFVGLGLWGRRSGGKVAALAFVALLCAFVYLTILMGE